MTKNDYEILKSNISFNQIELDNKNNEIEKYIKQIDTIKFESETLKKNINKLNEERKKNENDIIKYKEKGIKFDILEEENDNLNQKVILLNASLAQKDKEILNIKNLNDELTKTNNLLNKQVNEFKKILDKKDRNYDDLSSQKKNDKILMNEIVNKNIALINDNHNLKNNNNLLNNELEETLNKMTMLNHQINTNDLELKENKSIIDEIRAKNEKLELINKDFINQIQSLHNKISIENKKNMELNSQVLDNKKTIYELKKINDKNMNIISDMGKNKEDLNKIIDKLKYDLNEIKKENEALKEDKKAIQTEFKKLSDENSNNGINLQKMEKNQLILIQNMEKITQEKNDALNTVQQLKQEIQKLTEQISSLNTERKNISQKSDKQYENQIKLLNDQISQLESQIELLQNKLKLVNNKYQKENDYESNINILKEQINYLQNENKKLTSIINNDLTNRQNYRNTLRQNAQTNRTKLTESENEYMKQFINDFHNQVDELNYNNDNLAMSQNYEENNNNNFNNGEIKDYNNDYEEDEVNQEDENYNSNNSNDIDYQMDNNYQMNDDYIYQRKRNYKDYEDININKQNIKKKKKKEKEINFK